LHRVALWIGLGLAVVAWLVSWADKSERYFPGFLGVMGNVIRLLLVLQVLLGLSWVVVAFGVGVWLVVKLDIKQWPAWITSSP
jgi:hypothetical protein